MTSDDVRARSTSGETTSATSSLTVFDLSRIDAGSSQRANEQAQGVVSEQHQNTSTLPMESSFTGSSPKRRRLTVGGGRGASERISSPEKAPSSLSTGSCNRDRVADDIFSVSNVFPEYSGTDVCAIGNLVHTDSPSRDNRAPRASFEPTTGTHLLPDLFSPDPGLSFPEQTEQLVHESVALKACLQPALFEAFLKGYVSHFDRVSVH